MLLPDECRKNPMMRGLRGLFVGLLGLGGLLAAQGQDLTPQNHPLPTGVLATLYATAAQTGRPATVTSIHQLAGFKNRLFVAVTDSAGHEILDVWDTRNASLPTLVSSVDFGSVQTNGVMFTPLALVPLEGGLLLQVRTGFSLYRFGADGRLTFDRSVTTPNTFLGLGMTQLHVAGRHASMMQQVIPNERITAENLGAVHREVLFDLTDPEQPLFLWGGVDGQSVLNAEPLNSSFQGHPASLGFDASLNQIRLTEFEPTRDAQRDVYWMPKLQKVFAAGALEKPLRELLEQALTATDLDALQAQGVQIFAASNGPSTTLLSARILEHQVGTRMLKDVLAQYGIGLDEPLEMALAKVIAGHLDASLEARLAQEWYSPALQSWLDTLLAPGLKLRTADETRAALAEVFNMEIDEQTLARYLTRHVISPLLGNPGFMELKLGSLLDQTANSPVGETIDVMLQTAGGFGAVNGVLDSVRGVVDLIPGVDLPNLPACAQFPDSTDKLIDLAMFSWNEPGGGAYLDSNGLAWFELLKFYRYLTGHTDFTQYTADINQRLRAMQQTLGDNLASRLSDAFALPEGLTDLAALHAQVASERQARLLIGRLMANAVLSSIPTNESITATMSVRTALTNWGLRVQQLGFSESKVSDLVAAMQTHGLGQVTLGDVFRQAAAPSVEVFRTQIGQVLRLQAQESFGLSDLDLSLGDLLRPCVDFDVGVQQVMGSWMNGLLGELLADGPGMSSLLLEYRHAFENHDCIARWLVVLDAIGAASSFFGGDMAARALEYALHEAYGAGVGYVVETMFGRLIHETSNRGETTWLASQLSPRTRQWTLFDAIPNVTTTTLGAFGWQQRIAAVVQQRYETNWFGPRALKLVVCHPDDPVGTREVYDLGRWQTVNYVNHHEGALFVGGSYFAPTDGAFPSGKAIILDLSTATPRVQRLTGDAHTALASAPKLVGANYDACLAVGGLNRVFLIPNPSGASPVSDEPIHPPRFVQKLKSAEVLIGGAHTFSIRATGTAPLTYRWFKDGNPIPDDAPTQLDVVATNDAVGGVYSVVISNAVGSVTNTATLTVLAPETLRIVQQPADVARLLGQSVTLTVGVGSSGSPQYQWCHFGLPLSGATRAQLVLTNLTWAEAGDYHAVVSQGSSALSSRVARLELVEPGPPALLGGPAAQQPLALGTSQALTAATAGWGDITYRWFKDGQPIAGAAGATLQLGQVTTNTAGEYRLELRDAAGNVTTRTFTVVLVAAANLSGGLSAEGKFQVTVASGVPGQSYSLQRSTNLVHWSDVQTGVIPASGTLEYQDTPPVTGTSGAYFRLKVTP